MEAQFQAVVRDRAASGVTVLLSSHIMGEVEALCHRVSIIRSGKIVRAGTLPELRTHAASTVAATTPRPVPGLAELPGVTVTNQTPEAGGVHVIARVTPHGMVRAVSTIVAEDPWTLTVEPPSLDELFLDHYRS
jgi:ABC-2 type transport system ATP-binding protein